MNSRKATVKRETKETTISVVLNLDGTGKYEITTGITMFDHLLAQLARHGIFDLKIAANGDNQHHTVEDVALCLGQALTRLWERSGASCVWQMPPCRWMILYQQWPWISVGGVTPF